MQIVGVDLGGTFTDLILFDEELSQVSAVKVPSTPDDPARAVLDGLSVLAVDPAAIRHVMHGTTVATNAVLERKGARVGLVTTAGFRDVIEFGRTRRMLDGLFNPRFVRPTPLVPYGLRFEVRERLLHDGSVHEPLQHGDLARAAEQLARAGVESVAVCFLHAYQNPTHETQAGAILATALPDVAVSLSAEVVPEYREYERMSTTVLNAYVSPVMGHYLGRLGSYLSDRGYRARVFTMSSSGGVMTSERAGRLAVFTVLSGPVGGVNGAVAVAAAAGYRDLITFDMGGTSTDVCLVRDLSPTLATESVLSGFPLKMPHVDINTVGAGGGSIAWLDGSALQVGPRSAGAMPGPACYGRGGTEPTVTDANLFLGRIDPERVLGGAIRLQTGLAEQALSGLARRMGDLDLRRLADGIVRLAVARMTTSIREVSVQRGHDPRDFVLAAFGGAGPMHATLVAEELGMGRVLIPRHPGNLSALGLLTSDLRRDDVRTFLATLSALDMNALAREFADLEALGRGQLMDEGVAAADMSVARALDLRYLGQAFELTVPLPEAGLDRAAIRHAFNTQYLATYGHADEGAEIEVVNVRVATFGRVPKPSFPLLTARGSVDAARRGIRPVYFIDRVWETPFYERELLPPGVLLPGPAVIEEPGATTVVAPGWSVEVDGPGNLLLSS